MTTLNLKVLLSTLFSVILCVYSDSINKDIVNTKVDRTVDISSQLVRITTEITLENKGKSSVKNFLYTLETSISDHLSYISASVPSRQETDNVLLNVIPTTVTEDKGKSFWRIQLAEPLQPSKTIKVQVEAVFTYILEPFPLEITQQEKQFMRYYGNHYFYSPYLTITQTTKVQLASSNLESYTKLKPSSNSDSTITLGPYESIQPFSESELIVHSENNSPFLTVTRLVRVIEISHWGNVAVEETIDVRHTGAFLKGAFSRYDYQKEHVGVSSVKSFKTMLPASARDVYYRDEIGNISTSHMRVMDDSVELDVRPRFPLFGGWKTHYVIGYNVPSYEYIFNSGNEYVLKMRFVDHIYDDMQIDHVTTKVILPEGSSNINMKVPFEVKRGEDELHFTYLDTTGRPVIIAHKTNVVENHIQDFELYYSFERLLMLQEPLIAIIVLFLFFLLVIIYVRLDFSISKDEANESCLKVSGIMEQVISLHEQICAVYTGLESIVNQYKASKDNSAFQTAIKKFNAELKSEGQATQDLQAKLKSESPEAAVRVGELLKLQSQVRELQQAWITQVEKVVGGKLGKQQYADAERESKKKIEGLVDKMELIVSSL